MNVHVPRPDSLFKDFCPPAPRLQDSRAKHATRTTFRMLKTAVVAFANGDTAAFLEFAPQLEALFDDVILATALEVREQIRPQDE